MVFYLIRNQLKVVEFYLCQKTTTIVLAYLNSQFRAPEVVALCTIFLPDGKGELNGSTLMELEFKICIY